MRNALGRWINAHFLLRIYSEDLGMNRPWAELAGRVQLAWLITICLFWSISLALYPLDPGYTAGELLDHLQGWMETGRLYPSIEGDGSLRVLNYPPIVLVLARFLASLGIQPLLAGRLVNGLGVILVLGVIGWWVQARGRDWAVSIGSLGLLGASVPFVYGTGQFRIEMWAVLGTVMGWALMDRGRTGRAVLWAGVLLAMSCFVKQTQVVPSLVALIWAWKYRPTELRSILFGYLGTGIAGVAVITLVWGFEPWRHMLIYTTGTYSLMNLGWQFLSHVAPWAPLLSLAAYSVLRGRPEARSDPAWWYWCSALVWSFSAVRSGSSSAYFLDLHLATVMLAGPALFSARGVLNGGGQASLEPPKPRRHRLLPWILAFQVIAADIAVGTVAWINLSRVSAITGDLASICSEFPRSGPVLAEEASIARACGRTPLIHPFIMTSLSQRGLWDASDFETAVASGKIGTAVIGFDPRKPVTGAHADRWTLPVLYALRLAPEHTAYHSGVWAVSW